jgi:hypothetical protein
LRARFDADSVLSAEGDGDRLPELEALPAFATALEGSVRVRQDRHADPVALLGCRQRPRALMMRLRPRDSRSVR